LPVDATALTKLDSPPPFRESPYGIQGGGTRVPANVPGSAIVYQLCTNPD